MRRKWFNTLFYSHYSFVVDYSFSYLHVRETRPFLLIGMALYGFDRFLRVLWMLLPRRMVHTHTRASEMLRLSTHDRLAVRRT